MATSTNENETLVQVEMGDWSCQDEPVTPVTCTIEDTYKVL